MPIKGTKQRRKLCPYCSAEVAEGYLYLHKKQYCPMRPIRQEEVKAEAMGLPPRLVRYNVAGAIVTGAMQGAVRGATALTPDNGHKSYAANIIPINLTEEYNNMVKIMQKKKEAEEIDIGEEYQCGGCNTAFHAKKEPKHCPECGIEFG